VSSLWYPLRGCCWSEVSYEPSDTTGFGAIDAGGAVAAINRLVESFGSTINGSRLLRCSMISFGSVVMMEIEDYSACQITRNKSLQYQSI
jgi:hypothetical protein